LTEIHRSDDSLPVKAYDALRNLADYANIVAWMTDEHGRCIYLNSEVAAYFENLEDFVLQDLGYFMHAEDRARLQPVFQQAIARHLEYQMEYRLVRSNGNLRWMAAIGAPRFSANNQFIGYVGTICDVTSHHSTLERLEKSEAEMRLITENSADIITHHDAAGRILYISPSCLAVTGYSQEELLGSLPYEWMHPADAGTAQKKILDPRTSRIDRLVEARMRCKNGDYIWIESKACVLRDPVTGEKTGTVSIARDVTAEKRAQDELRSREERFRSLTSLSSDWYWETDVEDRFKFRSEGSASTDLSRIGDYLGKRRVDTAVNPADPQVLTYLEKVAKREPFRDIQFESNWGVEGVHRFVCISGEPVFEQGVFVGYRGVGRDRTKERLAAAELARLAAENRALVENTVDIMAMLDPEGRFLRVNRAVVDVLGYAPADMLGRVYAEFLHVDQLPMVSAIDAGLRSGPENTVKDLETIWVRKDGKLVHLSLGVRWVENQQVMFATARDVTESKRIQAELQKSKDALASVLESIGDAFFALDRNWRATYVNLKTARFLGHEQDKLIGQIAWEAIPELQGSMVMERYKEAMETGEPVFFEAYWTPAAAWVEIRAYPHPDGLSVFFHDISERRAAEEFVRESERKFREVIEMTPAGYLVADVNGNLMDVNPALCELAGYAESELVGTPVAQLFVDGVRDNALQLGGALQARQSLESILRHRTGRAIYVLVNANVQRDASGAPAGITAFVTDITERKEAADRLKELATHDSLTGLPNRALLNERLQSMIDTAKDETNIAVLFIDLDRFKVVNDTMGHEKGDQLLRFVSQRLERVLRPGDIVARLGGDEFVVAAYCPSGTGAAERIAEKVLGVLVAPFDLGGQEVYVGASIGISLFPQDGSTKEILFQNADTAMYEAKDSGRNGYRFFRDEMSVEAKQRLALESALRKALERNEFSMHYQPRIDLANGEVHGSEALLRWSHPQLGNVPPLHFIPIAEETGLIEAIGQWVLEESCRQTKELIDRLGQPLGVSVNLSARQLKCPNLVAQVSHALLKSGLPPEMLELELTESALIEDIEGSVVVLRALKALGISLAVDDFGTGYSGLAYLRKFPIDILKLDRSFVTQEDEGISTSRFIKAFVDMAHALNLSVVAEGVETEETLAMLKTAECDEAQGYLFARPMPFTEWEQFLASPAE
jgi:diguanylate cyclase (GGDEF)-like protein/PAS domain S-box-containing protein